MTEIPLIAIALALAAAVLHAGWNAMLRAGGDRFSAMVVMSAGASLAALPWAVMAGVPVAGAWPMLLISAVLHVGYNLALVWAYRHGELGLVYPLARGAAPLLVTLSAAIFVGEHLPVAALLGVCLVSVGILGLAGAKTGRAALLPAFLTSLFIAGYTVTDGLGARVSGDPAGYAAWLFVLGGLPMMLIHRTQRGRFLPPIATRETAKAAAGGVVSLVAYGLVIVAVAVAPMGAVSALRETSVLAAALMGRFFLGERLTGRRLAGCSLVAVGAVCLGFAG
ncbi:MAG TPA: EamA family transporter [Aliidongia sp.]|nr:EamA family transporter [Aliidongia sp.]